MKFLTLFGTRPEAVKLAPVIRELKRRKIENIVVSSGQHKDLLAPFLKFFDIKPDCDLSVMTKNQTPTKVLAKILPKLEAVFEKENPSNVIVQGDTITTLAGAIAGFNRKINVAHVEAGMRSGNLQNPFPEEINRRLVSQTAAFHFCATEGNRRNLLVENINPERIFVTGNTVIDSLKYVLKNLKTSKKAKKILTQTKGLKRIVLTTHRRESFGSKMTRNLLDLKEFIGRHKDVCLIFPVHPNPAVKSAAEKIFSEEKNIFLTEPLDYLDFISLLKSAWLIVSDSGGIQEESPTLGKPLFILRENTERPEAVTAGIAKLIGQNSLLEILEENYADQSWINSVKKNVNPFGDGKSAKEIVRILVNNS